MCGRGVDGLPVLFETFVLSLHVGFHHLVLVDLRQIVCLTHLQNGSRVPINNIITAVAPHVHHCAQNLQEVHVSNARDELLDTSSEDLVQSRLGIDPLNVVMLSQGAQPHHTKLVEALLRSQHTHMHL